MDLHAEELLKSFGLELLKHWLEYFEHFSDLLEFREQLVEILHSLRIDLFECEHGFFGLDA